MSQEQTMQFKSEGEPAFQTEDTEKENSGESSPESKETNIDQTGSSDQDNNQTQKQDGDAKPGEYDKKSDLNNPPVERWMEREKDWVDRFNKQEQRHVEDMTKLTQLITGLESKLTPSQPKADAVADEMPPWFGGTEDEWKNFSDHIDQKLAKVKTDAKTEAINELMSKGTEEQKAIQEATQYMNDEIAKIEGDKTLNPTGEKVDKNRLMKIAEDFHLVDANNKWNWQAAYAFYRNVKAPKPANTSINEKKEIAGATIGDKKSESKPPVYKTSDDFQNPAERPW